MFYWVFPVFRLGFTQLPTLCRRFQHRRLRSPYLCVYLDVFEGAAGGGHMRLSWAPPRGGLGGAGGGARAVGGGAAGRG
eukprot:1011687-Prorocentrum_minimum.AAC.1